MLQRPDSSLSTFFIGHSWNLFPFILGFMVSRTSWDSFSVTMASLSNSLSSSSTPGVEADPADDEATESSLDTGCLMALLMLMEMAT